MSSNNSSPTPSESAQSVYLRRRSGPQDAGSSIQPNQSIASRRPSALQMDYSLKLTSLNELPDTPIPTRSTTPTPSANSIASPFGKKRAAAEIEAVASMVASNDIQRPASAPPRGSRSLHISKEQLDDIGAEMMEAAQLGPSSPSKEQASPYVKEATLDVVHVFTSNLSDRSLALLFLFIVMWGAVLSLDRLTTYSYQTIATNSFSSHSSLAMINVIRSVVAAVAAIPFAVVADLCGRYQAFTIALLVYAAGHAVMAGSMNIPSYIGGVVLYEIGANALVCLQYTVMADVTSSRNRLFFQILPQMPFLIFSFISSDVYSAILPRWRWGVGMFAIIGPISLIPVVWILHTSQKGQKGLAMSSTQSLRRASIQQNASGPLRFFMCLKHLWILADLFGLLLLAASLSLVLIPLTLAASSPERWENANIIGMISSGVAIGLLFGYWETRKASKPIFTSFLLHNRTFWGGGASLCLLWSAHALMSAYLPTFLYVVFNTSNRAQQNISVIYSFTIAASSLPIALIVRYSRRYKIFALIGVAIFTAGLGIMIPMHASTTIFHIVASQITIGLGGAMTISLIMAAVQVSVPSACVAQSIAALNVFPCLGNAIGAAVAGAMWSNLLPGRLIRDLASSGHSTEVHNIYSEPLTWIESYSIGTMARTGVIEAYSSVWRLMLLTATLICSTSAVSVMVMKNIKLNDFLSVIEESDKKLTKTGGEVELESEGKLFGDRLFEKVEHALWKSCVRCGLGRSKSQSDPKNGEVTSATNDNSTSKRSWNFHFKNKKQNHRYSSSEDSKSSIKSGKDASSDSAESPYGLPPILIIDDSTDEQQDYGTSHLPQSAPAGPSSLFRPPHSANRSSPLARKDDQDSYL